MVHDELQAVFNGSPVTLRESFPRFGRTIVFPLAPTPCIARRHRQHGLIDTSRCMHKDRILGYFLHSQYFVEAIKKHELSYRKAAHLLQSWLDITCEHSIDPLHRV